MAKKATSPAALKLKECDRFIKVLGEKEKCPGQWLGNKRCPKWDDHLMKYPSGHCANGSHEGAKHLSPSGKVMKPCHLFVTCPCKCHADLDKLFALTDRERIYVDVSVYAPEPSPFVGPSDDPEWYYGSSNPDRAPAPRSDEDTPTDAARVPVAPTYQPTPTGRAARGELESWVHDALQVWLVEQDGEFTPAYVAKEISRTQAIVPPSVGAIDAVFKRWVKIGFAEMAKKPTRITQVTPEGKTLGLAKIKVKAKRDRQLAAAALRRGTLR